MDEKKTAKNPLERLVTAFKEGSFATRLSFFVPGAGQLARKQYVKGGAYLLLTYCSSCTW